MPTREKITLFFPPREHTASTAEQKSAGFGRWQGTLSSVIRLNWVTAGATGVNLTSRGRDTAISMLCSDG